MVWWLLMRVAGLEGDVHSEGPIARWRLSLEVVHRPRGGRVRDVVAFRIDAGVVGRLPEVPAGSRDAHLARPHGFGPLQGELVGNRGLPEADKVRLLHEAPLSGRPRLPQRHHARLLLKRGGRIDQSTAVIARLAADTVRAVQEVVPRLQVKQANDPHLAVEQVDAVRQGDLPARLAVPDEDHRVTYEDFVRYLAKRVGESAGSDDAVAVSVPVRVGSLPISVDWVAPTLLHRGANDRRHAAHVGDEVGVVGAIEGHEPTDGRPVHELSVHKELDPTIHDRTQVLKPGSGSRTQGGGYGARDQRVLGALVVVGEVDVEPAGEQRDFAPDFDLPRPLRLQVWIADRTVDQAGLVRAIHVGRLWGEEPERVRRSRVIARETQRAPQS